MRTFHLKSPAEALFIPTMSVPERRAFNILFGKLYGEKDTDLRTARRWLSGVRSGNGSHKATKGKIKPWLAHWHRMGLIAIVHGRVRLGNLNLSFSALDDRNMTRLQERLLGEARYSMGLGYALGQIEGDLEGVDLREYFRNARL